MRMDDNDDKVDDGNGPRQLARVRKRQSHSGADRGDFDRLSGQVLADDR